jgi:hypothetical protein
MPRTIGQRKYEPLTRYLITFTEDEVTLSLGEVE